MEERKQYIQQIIQALKTKNEIAYIEGAFRHYIDNKISERELDFILKNNDEKLPDSFFDLSVREKKTYYTHTRTSIKVENDSYRCANYEVFNKQYFYRLAEAAKKNKTLTADIIKYAAEVGFDLNLMFIFMQNIKLDNIKATLIPAKLRAYRESKDETISSVFDLAMSIMSEPDGVLKAKGYKNELFSFLNNSKFLDITIGKFFEFALIVECVLNDLPRKDANTLKIKFLVLKPEHLRDFDYYGDEPRQQRVINTCRNKLKKSKALSRARNFVSDSKNWFDNLFPNGYSAIYNFLLEE